MVATVVDAPAKAVAGREVWLIPITVHIVQEDVPSAIAKVGIGPVVPGVAAAHLPTHYTSIIQAPVVITDSAPVPSVEDLHSALAGVGAIH